MKIDAEFKALIPPLRLEEREGLEHSIATEGVRDPLVVWTEEDVLLDGHNRYEIASRLKKPFNTVGLSFASREAAADWIDANQLARRNLTPDQMSLLRGRRYNRAKRQGERTDLTSDQFDTKLDTAARIGKQHGVGQATIKRDGAFASAVDKLKATAPDIERKITEGTAPPKAAVIRAAQLLEKAPEKADAILRGEAGTVRQMTRDLIREELAQRSPEFPTGKYRVIYADPPWAYGNTQPDYHPEQSDHYTTMTMEELEAFPVPSLTEDNAVLFLWATSPILPEALDLAKAWGFKYKASFVWDKIKHNMGHYNSVRHEFLLVCVKGSCQPDVRKLFDSVQSIERTAHSEKPEQFREIIDTIYTHGDRIELFARKECEGWTVYGNEATA